MMYTMPKNICPGDTIRIVAPAKSISYELVSAAATLLINNGFNVQISEHCCGEYNYFSGNLNERLQDFQDAIDDPSIKAILCARGGYGSVQLVDKLNWSRFLAKPKWIIGFSDITVFHQRLSCMQIASIHGTMPLNFQENTSEAISTLLCAMKEGRQPTIQVDSNSANCFGTAQGVLIGGNASIVYSLLGTNDQPDYSGTILFLEDLAEQLYHIDRIFYSLKKANVLSQINGLLIGGMTDMKDTMVPYGESLEAIILNHVRELNIPVAFGFPAGHINDNRALVFGDLVDLHVSSSGVQLSSLS